MAIKSRNAQESGLTKKYPDRVLKPCPVLFKAYSWLCAQGSLLEGLRGFWGGRD